LTAPLIAQRPAPIGLVHGSLLACERNGGSGELTVRTENNQVFHFTFDDKSYFEREQELSTPGMLEKGDWLEIVVDRSSRSLLGYARTVHVMERKTLAHSRLMSRTETYHSPLDSLFPRGDLTFSGVVEQLSAERLILRTRTQGEKTILLRQDTSYVADGDTVDSSALQPSLRVFVRAGTNLENQIEAYQVIWGEILKPR
jgi:hypothetical protein